MTLARDVQKLLTTHRIVRAAAFDQFPYTHHLEAGVFLVRREVEGEVKAEAEARGESVSHSAIDREVQEYSAGSIEQEEPLSKKLKLP